MVSKIWTVCPVGQTSHVTLSTHSNQDTKTSLTQMNIDEQELDSRAFKETSAQWLDYITSTTTKKLKPQKKSFTFSVYKDFRAHTLAGLPRVYPGPGPHLKNQLYIIFCLVGKLIICLNVSNLVNSVLTD